MNLKRIASGLRQTGRVPEVLRCLRYIDSPIPFLCGYLGITQLEYPRKVRFGDSLSVTVSSWEDLTTAWVVLLGNEYRILQDDAVIIDLGANIGVFAAYAYWRNPAARIISVEPFPGNFNLLVATVDENGLRANVECREYAVAGETGVVTFDADPSIPSHSRRIAEGTLPDSQVQVKALSLADFLDCEQLEEVDFAKIDIEGAEYQLIESSSSETLRRAKRYGIEYHGRGVQSIADVLAGAGFKISHHPKRGKSGVVEFTRV